MSSINPILDKVDEFSSESKRNTIVFKNDINSLNIKKAKCIRFVEANAKHPEVCCCGFTLRQHSLDADLSRTRKEWRIDECVSNNEKTDAFGQIQFVKNGVMAKYIRLHHKTDSNKILDVLFNAWKLPQPNLLISVTGGAQKFNPLLKNRLNDVFRIGLVRAATSSNAWISTGGLNAGVMKNIGEVFSQYPNENIVLLGVAPWTMVNKNEKLINDKNNPYREKVEDYVIEDDLNKTKNEELIQREHVKQPKKQYLDSNHTHFILVDNGKQSYSGEIELRAQLESAISKQKHKPIIPIVVLVVEGGRGTIETVHNSIKSHLPCVFLDGSGKCADIVSFAIRTIQRANKRSLINLESDLAKRIGESEISKNESDIKDLVKKILEIVNEKNLHLLSVFDLNQRNDIDVAILKSLLKKDPRENPIAKLKLALTWDRVEVARKGIFDQNGTIDINDLHEVMYKAMIQDKIEFVELLLENGFKLSNFLTYRRLLFLFNDLIKEKKILYSYLIRFFIYKKTYGGMEVFDFHDLGKVLRSLVDFAYDPRFCLTEFKNICIEDVLNDSDSIGNAKPGVIQREYRQLGPQNTINLNDKVDNPEIELFLMMILNTRYDMAKVFWREGNHELCASLVASKILKKFASEYYEESIQLNERAAEFEDIAVGILDECYKQDETTTEKLITREIPEFGHLTCLQVASASECKKFIGHSCCQNYLTKLWYNKISPNSSLIWIILCFLCPFLSPFLLHFTDKTIDTSDSFRSVIRKDGVGGFFKKLIFFSKTPFVKFVYTQIFYVLFLLLFSYVLLCDFFPIDTQRYRSLNALLISPTEILLIIWVTMYSIEEVRKFWRSEAKLFVAKVKSFLSFWNMFIEMMAIILYYLSLVLRFIPNSSDCYLAARILLSIDIIFWYIKALSFYSVIRNLGPKLVMIKKMLLELLYFISIVLVFIFAFGVSTQALMYHNQELNRELLKQVFFPSYFIISGEYYTRETIMSAKTCQQRNESLIDMDIYSQEDCPEHQGANVSLALYVGYIILLNILLVNLLIAIFSYTFDKVQDETDDIWKFQRYALVYEYYFKPKLAAPFVIFSYIFEIFRFLGRSIRLKLCPHYDENFDSFTHRFVNYLTKETSNKFSFKPNEDEQRYLTKWESYYTDECLSKSLSASPTIAPQESQHHDLIQEKMDEIRDEMKARLDSLEEKLNQNLNKLFFKSLNP